MEPFTVLRGVAAPLDEPNLDTNQLCPSRFNKTVVGPGYERVLFHDRRFNADGSEKPDFVLNRKPWRAARILIGSSNFGCGSSRETAVTALLGFGIRAVIAAGFADIFFSNALKNGLLPVTLEAGAVAHLLAAAAAKPGLELTVDLQEQQVVLDGEPPFAFEIDALRREKLLLGLDDIGLTERFTRQASAFEIQYLAAHPWLPPSLPSAQADDKDGDAPHFSS